GPRPSGAAASRRVRLSAACRGSSGFPCPRTRPIACGPPFSTRGWSRSLWSRPAPAPRRCGSQSSASSPPPLRFDPVTEPRVRVPLPGDVLELLEVEFFFDLLQRPFLDRGGGFARALRRLAQARVDPLHLPARNLACRCWCARRRV